MEQKQEGVAIVAVAKKEELVSVTMSHPGFGTYTFGVEESKLAASIPSALAKAKRIDAVSKEVASIDAQQAEIAAQIAHGHTLIAAARVLNDTGREAREQSACNALQKSVNALAERRQKLFESLDQ